VNYPAALLDSMNTLAQSIPAEEFSATQRRWLALQSLEGDIYSQARAGFTPEHVQSVRDAMQAQQQEEPELVIADARYQTIAD
ncbi:hypothetical protein R0J93_26710, partial [Pseudoalteromonas sp. SIMBA_148]